MHEAVINSRIDEIIPKNIYHYTSLEKFKCILKYGTLRFKLSTQSNDLLDTNFILELIKKLDYFTDTIDDSKKNLLEFLIGYYKHDRYVRSYESFVSCFTDIEDSRLLWDAYTMNRPPQGDEDISQYNGICLAFNRDKLMAILQKFEHAHEGYAAFLAPVWYDKDKQIKALNYLINQAFKVFDSVKDEPDQNQSIVPPIKTGFQLDFGGYKGEPHYFELKLKKALTMPFFAFIESVDKTSPFFKHKFWSEEREYRASIGKRMAIPNEGIVNGTDENKYIDVPIRRELIDYIILGPCFSEEDRQSIEKMIEPHILFNQIEQRKSIGTGIITMR